MDGEGEGATEGDGEEISRGEWPGERSMVATEKDGEEKLGFQK